MFDRSQMIVSALMSVALGLLLSALITVISLMSSTGNAAYAPDNVGQVMLPAPPIWPPPRAEWISVPEEFVVGKTVDAPQSSKAVCTVPPKKWHGMTLRKCDQLHDGSIACMYKIRAHFRGTDGSDVGDFAGLLGVRRRACKDKFVPELVEMLPVGKLDGAADPGDSL